MASNYPTSLDNFTNPTVSDYLNSTTVPHATQHSDLNDAVENLQAKVGIDSSADTDSIDYKVTDAASRITTLEAGATANAVVAYADLSARTAANPSPSEGDVSWQEDTNRFDIYNGTAWAEVGATRGVLDYASATATTAYTAGTPLSVLTVTATIEAGRVYRLGGKVCAQASSNNTGLKTLYVSASGMTTVQLAGYTLASGTNLPFYLNGETVRTATQIGVTSGSASTTFTLYLRDQNNNGGLNTNPDAIVGANTFPQEFWIEDIGAA
jgi:hypothetical protein